MSETILNLIVGGVAAFVGFAIKQILIWAKDGYGAPSAIRRFEDIMSRFEKSIDTKLHNYDERIECLKSKTEKNTEDIKFIKESLDCKEKYKIILVDDDDQKRELIELQLTDLGHTVISCDSYESFTTIFNSTEIDGIVSDYNLSNGKTGLDVFEYSKDKIQKPNGKKKVYKFLLYSGSAESFNNLPTGIMSLKTPVELSELNKMINMAF